MATTGTDYLESGAYISQQIYRKWYLKWGAGTPLVAEEEALPPPPMGSICCEWLEI
jgi:hypothetical protein